MKRYPMKLILSPAPRAHRGWSRNIQIEADFAMPFPDSGNYAAIGFCQESGMPLEMGVIRNHYVGMIPRTSIIDQK